MSLPGPPGGACQGAPHEEAAATFPGVGAPDPVRGAHDQAARERDRERARLARVRSLDEQIGEALRDSEARGELRRAPSWGRPMRADDGFDETPVEWRMPFKILKNAGMAPPEVELMQEIRALQQRADAAPTPTARDALLRQLADKRQHLALRLERFGRSSRD